MEYLRAYGSYSERDFIALARVANDHSVPLTESPTVHEGPKFCSGDDTM